MTTGTSTTTTRPRPSLTLRVAGALSLPMGAAALGAVALGEGSAWFIAVIGVLIAGGAWSMLRGELPPPSPARVIGVLVATALCAAITAAALTGLLPFALRWAGVLAFGIPWVEYLLRLAHAPRR